MGVTQYSGAKLVTWLIVIQNGTRGTAVIPTSTTAHPLGGDALFLQAQDQLRHLWEVDARESQDLQSSSYARKGWIFKCHELFEVFPAWALGHVTSISAFSSVPVIVIHTSLQKGMACSLSGGLCLSTGEGGFPGPLPVRPVLVAPWLPRPHPAGWLRRSGWDCLGLTSFTGKFVVDRWGERHNLYPGKSGPWSGRLDFQVQAPTFPWVVGIWDLVRRS